VASGATLVFDSPGYTLTSASSVSGSGSVVFDSGTTTLGGTLSASGGFTIQNGATAQGSAALTGNLTNNGTLIVGTPTTAGTLTINGNYTQGSGAVLNIAVGGLTPGTQYDQLNVTGTATLAGTLNLSLINGYLLTAGSTFYILNWGSDSGSFSTINGTSQGGRTFVPVYESTDLKLNVVVLPALPADDALLDQEEKPEVILAAAVYRNPQPAAKTPPTAETGTATLEDELEPFCLPSPAAVIQTGNALVDELFARLASVEQQSEAGPADQPVLVADGMATLRLMEWFDVLVLPIRLVDELFESV
jgi:hypothetical protein